MLLDGIYGPHCFLFACFPGLLAQWAEGKNGLMSLPRMARGTQWVYNTYLLNEWVDVYTPMSCVTHGVEREVCILQVMEKTLKKIEHEINM